MANASIGGLVSGLDTATIISQLIQLEARPQTMLKSRVSTAERAVTALQTFNAKLASLATKAAELSKAPSWQPMTATSSQEAVTVTAGSGAVPQALTLSVVQRASAYYVDYGVHAATSPVTTNGSNTVKLTVAGVEHLVDTKDGTVQGLVTALNSGSFGVTAGMVRQTDGQYRLQIATTDTGSTAGFTLTDDAGGALAIDASAAPPVIGKNARITVGADTIESATNTFTDLMPGVSVTLNPGATGDSTITVARDTTAIVDKVKSLVEVVNTALAEVDSLTATGADPKARGLLSGDPTLRQVRNELLQAVTYGVGGESLAPYGVSTDRSGKLVFDEAKFKAAYEADPTKTTAMFAAADPNVAGAADGLAAKLDKIAEAFSNSTDGIVSLAIKSRQAAIRGMEDDIADWDVRLEVKRNALQRQYTALESALGKLQSQGNWLAGQLASLPQMSSGQ